LLVALAGAVLCQRQDILVIDNFATNTPTLTITVNASVPVPSTRVISTTDASGILGGERDLSLTVTDSIPNRSLNSGVRLNSWATSTTTNCAGFAIMQYDGVDNSPNLKSGGFGSTDLRQGNGDAFRVAITSDIPTEYTFTVYSGSSQSSLVQEIPGASTNTYTLNFASFQGNANFGAVTAIEVRCEAFSEVDTTLSLFTTSGIPSGPAPPPAASAGPTPPPRGGFTWYTLDDDNGRDPCDKVPPRRNYFVNNDNVVYYYFYGYHVDDEDLSTFESASGADAIVPVFAVTLIAMIFSAIF
jgi:hypothetical protein